MFSLGMGGGEGDREREREMEAAMEWKGEEEECVVAQRRRPFSPLENGKRRERLVPIVSERGGGGGGGEERRNQGRGMCSSKRRRAVLTFRSKLLVLFPRLAGLTELELRSSIPTLAETVFFPESTSSCKI